MRSVPTALALLLAAAFIVATFLIQALLTPLLAPHLPGLLLRSAIPLALATLLSSFVLPRPEGAGRVSGLGLGPGRRHPRYLLFGLVAGTTLAGGITAIQCLSGAIVFERGAPEVPWPVSGPVAAFGVSLAVFAVASAGEELLFRGYGFQFIGRAITPIGAALATALLFGAMHASNPSAGVISTINTALFGFLFGLALVRHRSLWLPYGAHLGWNFTLAILGAEISGLKLSIFGLVTNVRGPQWLSGGEYGPEASVLTTASVALASWLLLRAPVLDDDAVLIWDEIDEAEPPSDDEGG